MSTVVSNSVWWITIEAAGMFFPGDLNSKRLELLKEAAENLRISFEI